jgi:hypothetical protein
MSHTVNNESRAHRLHNLIDELMDDGQITEADVERIRIQTEVKPGVNDDEEWEIQMLLASDVAFVGRAKEQLGEIIGDTVDPGEGRPKDVFGVDQIYASKQVGPGEPAPESWHMDPTSLETVNNDPRIKFGGDENKFAQKNADGSFRMLSDKGATGNPGAESGKVRVSILTSSGDNMRQPPGPGEPARTYDQEVLSERGFMQDERDWTNVEMTAYVKVNAFSERRDDHRYFGWFARGGAHNDEVPNPVIPGQFQGCEGTAYKPRISYSNGESVNIKELWHDASEGYASRGSKDHTDGDPLEGWVGIKTVIYTRDDGSVVQELWLDLENDGTWELANSTVDRGGWEPSSGVSNRCGGEDDQIITWGGPRATFRWDWADSVDVKAMSVREIEPGQRNQ